MAVDIESIGFGVDTAGVKTGARDLDALGRSADQASRKADNLGKTVNKGSKEIGGLGKSADISTAAIARFGGAVGIAYSALQASRALVAAADQYTKLTAQIRNATRSQQEYNAAFADTTRIAKIAQSEIEGVTKLYARLNLALRDANRSQQEVATITETVALALKVSGASVAESTSTMLQLSQAFGSGVLRGEEFNAVMESAPPLMRRLAESMGVPIGQLRNLASEGRITIEELTKAFNDSKYLSTLREQAKNVQTIGGAWQVFKNEVILSIGEIDKAVGGSSFFSSFISGLGMALKEASGRGGNTTVRKENPEEALFGNLKKGMFFGGLSGLQIGDTPEIVKKREAVFAELTKTLRLTSVETEKLNALQKQANDALAAGNITGKMHAQIIAGIRDERTRLSKKNKEEKDDYADLIKQQNEMIFAENEALAERALRIREEQTATIEGLQKQLMGWESLSEAEQAAWEIQNGRYKDFDTQSKEEILRLTEMIDLKQKIADLEKSNMEDARRIEDDMVNETLAGMKKRADEHKKMWESIDSVAHDTFVSIFDSGKNTFDRLRDTLKNGLYSLLYQMTIKKWIISISAGVAGGGASGVAGAATDALASSGAGGFGSIGNILSTGKSLISGFQGSLQGSIETLGATIANGMGGFADTVGGFLGTYSAQISNVLPFAGAAIQLLSGDAKGAAFTAAGAAIGSIIPGIGTAIGGIVGSVVGSLFGGKKSPPRIGAAVSTSFESGDFEVTKIEKIGKKLMQQAVEPLTVLSKAFYNTLAPLLESFGANSSMTAKASFQQKTKTKGAFEGALDGNNFSVRSEKGESFETFQVRVMTQGVIAGIQASKSISYEVKDLFDGIFSDIAGDQDRINRTNKLIADVISLNEASEELSNTFGVTVDQAAKAIRVVSETNQERVDLVGYLASAAQSLQSVGEKILSVRDVLNDAFQEIHSGTLPTSLEDFDALLKGINKTTSEGITEFGELLKLRSQAAEYNQAIDSLKGGVKSSLFGILSPADQQAQVQADLALMFGKLNMEIPGSVQELISLGKSIDYTTEEGLNLAAAFPSLVAAFQQAREQTDALVNSLQSLDTSRFATLIDYTRAVRYAESGINIANLPSYDVGTSYVPQDGPANIHAGERIFTRTENAEIVEAVRASNGNSAAVVSEIRNLRAELKAGLYSVASNTAETARINRKWDGDGLPGTRDISV
jgi:tape measure domain-containing protein